MPWEKQRGADGELEPMKEFRWDQDIPLTRARWETQKANRALKDYIAMGPGRSLSKLHRSYTEGSLKEEAPTRCLRTLKGWSTRYAWQARLARWAELEREGEEGEWRDRRKQIKRDEWEAGGKLLERAEKMLGYPLAEVIQEDKEGTIFRVQPVRWRQSDVTRFMEAASKLRRLAADMETEKKQVDITSKGEQIGRAEHSDAELAAEIAELAARIAEIEGADEGEAPGATDPGGADEP